MLRISFMIPEEQVNYIQRHAFEAEGRKKIVMEMIDVNKETPTVLESPTFEKYHKGYVEAMASFEIAKSQIEKLFVPRELKTPENVAYTDWTLDYLTNTMSITFKSNVYDCNPYEKLSFDPNSKDIDIQTIDASESDSKCCCGGNCKH